MRRQGGINNAALFGASQRSARNKLETMGGIQRNPRGILASSSALMQAAAPRAMTPPPPMMQQASMPMVQPALPQVPMQTTVAPMVQQAPVQQQAPAQQQQASMNPMQQDAVKLQEGGKIDVTQSPTAAPMTRFQLAMFGLGSDIYEKVLGKYGSEKKAEEEAVKKRDKIKKVASETDDSVTIANEVMRASEVEPTDDNKKDFAENVFGLTDVNDIDEINDRIAKVAINSTIGGGTQGTDKFARAVLLGLQNYKQTAAARAAAASGGSGFENMPTYTEALPNMIKTIITADPGISIDEATAQAQKVLDPLYGRTSGGAPAQQQPQNTEQMPTTPGTRFRDNQTGKIMVVGEDGKPREE